MKRVLWLAPALWLSLAGCGEDKTPAGQEPPLLQTATVAVPTPDFDRTSLLRLVSDGKDIRVGMNVDLASLVFPRPDQGSVQFRDLPPGFGPEFQSKGWQTDAEGVGIITLNGQVVTAVHTEQGVDENRVGQILKKYQLALDSRFVPSLQIENPAPNKGWARYWFLEDGQDRLMVCAVRLKTGVLNVTEAIGFDKAMDALRMGKEQAKHDLERAPVKGS